jgi:hypothetical protein
MNEWQTIISIPESPVKINYHKKCLFIGSCFSDYIGKIMLDYKFPLLSNPYGTLFNPLSIASGISNLINPVMLQPEDLHFHNELWFSFSHHTSFSHPDKNTCLLNINNSLASTAEWLKHTDFLVITFGTSFAYLLNETDTVVANCHKLPASSFHRILLQPASIIAAYDTLIEKLKEINHSLEIIFTVSPVRHLADGAVNNQLSKSILHCSIHSLLEKHSHVSYFPSYEIYMDELRDYRFYASDMVHPSEQGARYIWQRFTETWMDKESKSIMADVEAVAKAVAHRPLHLGTITYKRFKQNTLKKLEQLTGHYPFLDFSKEKSILQSV